MTPATVIRRAEMDGVCLSLAPSGSVKATGDQFAVRRWAPSIRDQKAGIVAALLEASSNPSIRRIPDDVRQLIARVVALCNCPESDHNAFADDWQADPEGIERGLQHLADHYGTSDMPTRNLAPIKNG